MVAASADREPRERRGPRAPREPKYYVVKRHLLKIIDTLPPGSPVPTERLLTTELSTSRTTVRQALGELVGEGRLVRRQGSGTFVAEPKVSWPLQMTSFTEQATANGRVASTRLLHAQREKADDEVAARLGVRPGELVHRIERLRLVDDTPMAVETSHLSARRFPGLARRLRQGDSLYRVLRERYATVPVAAEETIETATASPREAELLNTDTGSPMLVLSRHSFDADGVAVEWVQSWYRGDRYRFVARLTAP
jgi:GntR family transcriptional regulator